jgi:DNA mismatch repair ATPase MutL
MKKSISSIQNLSKLQGEIHQFKGIIDRFGTFESKEGRVITVCVRNLRLVKTNQRVEPDHWWFRRRQEWAVLNLQPDDEVSFTAKIQRKNKGYQDDLNNQVASNHSPRRIDFGPSLTVRDLCVLKHKKYIEPVVSEKEKLLTRLDEEVREKNKYAELFYKLNLELEDLQTQIVLNQNEFQAQTLNVIQKHQKQLTEKDFQFENIIKDNRVLTNTVTQLEHKLACSIPRKRSLTWFSISAVIGLVMGIGLSGTATRSFAR